jgi:hypothetical protein
MPLRGITSQKAQIFNTKSTDALEFTPRPHNPYAIARSPHLFSPKDQDLQLTTANIGHLVAAAGRQKK